MMRCLLLTLLSLLLMCTAAVAGAGTLTVEAVVSPAWVEHAGGAREPLVPRASRDLNIRIATVTAGKRQPVAPVPAAQMAAALRKAGYSTQS